jgi:hypothetical protein
MLPAPHIDRAAFSHGSACAGNTRVRHKNKNTKTALIVFATKIEKRGKKNQKVKKSFSVFLLTFVRM